MIAEKLRKFQRQELIKKIEDEIKDHIAYNNSKIPRHKQRIEFFDEKVNIYKNILLENKSVEDVYNFVKDFSHKKNFKNIILKKIKQDYFKKATKEDYIKWLNGYLEDQNNDPTKYFHYDFNADNHIDPTFYIATKDIPILCFYGVGQFNLIVPKGINVETKYGTGHCNLYFMGDYQNVGDVPIYKDIIEDIEEKEKSGLDKISNNKKRKIFMLHNNKENKNIDNSWLHFISKIPFIKKYIKKRE
jgi:hypothetical protein